MVKVYFEIQEGDEVSYDLEGVEFADLVEAKSEAEASLQEMLAADIANDTPPVPRSITILDENGKELADVELQVQDAAIADTQRRQADV